MGNIYTGSNSGKAGLNVKKTDNTVDVFGVSQIQLDSNLTLTDNGNGSVTINSTGGGGGGSGVTELSFGSTGLTPAVATTGSITVAGTLEVGSGGTGLNALGSADQFLKVNGAGTALEYATVNTGIDGSGAANQVAVFSDADTIGGSSNLTFTDTGVGGTQTLMVAGGEPRIQTQDRTAGVGFRNTITIDPSVPDGSGGVAMFWGTDGDLEEYMKLGAFDGANNIETKDRNFRFFGDTGNLITMDESALNTAVGGIFGLNNGSDPLPNPTRTLDVGKQDSSTNTVLNILGLTRQSSGTPAVGIGVGMDFVVETSANNNEIGATIEAITTNVGSTTEAFDFTFKLMAGGATAAEKMRIASTGAITFNQAYTFPTADGNAGEVLQTDGGGNLSFAAVAGYSGWIAQGGGGLTTTIDSGDTLEIAGGTGITTTLSGTGTTTPTLTIDVDGTSPTGTGAANQVAYWTGANTLTGNNDLTWDGQTLKIIDASDGTLLQVESTSALTGSAPDIVYYANRVSPQSGDDLGVIVFKGNDSGGAAQEFARISAEANTVTAGSEDGQLDFRVFQAGSIASPMRITEDGVFVNISNNANLDFVVDTQSQDGAFRVDSSADDIRTLVPFRDEIEIKSTDAGAAVAPDLKLYRNSGSPAANDVIGQVLFSGEDSASAKIDYASITGFIVDASAGAHDGAIVFNCVRNGTSAPYFEIGQLTSGVRAMTVNPNGLDNDFYIKTVNQSEAFKMDSSADTATFNVSFLQTTANPLALPPTEGGNITSTTTTVEMALNTGLVQAQEIGLKQTAAAHQVELGKTTTQSFGQTQNLSFATGPTDFYPSQGGLIVCDDLAGNATQTINLACMVDLGGRFSPTANPPNTAGGGTPVTGIPDKSGYGTWQIGDQVTVLTRFTGGGTPNITILSYAGVDDGAGGSNDPNNTAGGGGAPSQQIPINGVTTGTTITSNYNAKTFILTEDAASATQVSWVAIG